MSTIAWLAYLACGPAAELFIDGAS